MIRRLSPRILYFLYSFLIIIFLESFYFFISRSVLFALSDILFDWPFLGLVGKGGNLCGGSVRLYLFDKDNRFTRGSFPRNIESCKSLRSPALSSAF